MASETTAVVSKNKGITRIPSEIIKIMNIEKGDKLIWTVVGNAHAILLILERNRGKTNGQKEKAEKKDQRA